MSVIAAALFILALTYIDQRTTRPKPASANPAPAPASIPDPELETRALAARALLARAEADAAMVEAGFVPIEDQDAIDLSEWD